MKKTILKILTLLLVFSLFSCSESPETSASSFENISKTEDVVYTDSSELDFLIVPTKTLSDKGNIMYKLYPEEGAMVPLCPDPLCKHNSVACPFYDVYTLMPVKNNIIYYLRSRPGNNTNFKTICSYDLNNDTFTVLYETESDKCGISNISLIENYVYFTACISLDNNKGYDFRLRRLNLSTGETEQLSEQNEGDNVTFVKEENDRLFWNSVAGFYYSTDKDYKNRIDNEKRYHARMVTGNECFDYEVGAKPVGGRPAYMIYCVDELSGEKELVLENSGMFPAFYNGKIIYAVAGEELRLGFREYNGRRLAVNDPFGNKYYICNTDGSDKKLLCDISGNLCAIRASSTLDGAITGIGDYVVLEVDSYKIIERTKGTDKECIEISDYKYAVINIVTGEYKIVGVE